MHKKLKISLINISLILLAFSFPLQVLLKSELPALFPYTILILLFILNFLTKIKPINNLKYNLIDYSLIFFLFLIIIHSIFQLTFNLASFYETFSSFFIYSFPILFYIYFKKFVNLNEFKSIFITFSIIGFLVGLFGLYDTLSKLLFFTITDYTQKAVEYSSLRGAIGSTARSELNYRSFGLLQFANISSIWILIGCFSALTVIPFKKTFLRYSIIIIFGALIIISLNTTSIVAFFCAIMYLEVRIFSLFNLKISNKLISFSIAIILLLISFFLFVPDQLLDFILNNFSAQFIFATKSNDGYNSLIGDIISSFKGRYYTAVLNFPFMLLLGDGFTSFGMMKGSDNGYIESLARLGFPFFIFVIFSFLRIIKDSHFKVLTNIKLLNFSKQIYLFSVIILLLILIYEIHYSTWGAKSVLPVLLISLAIQRRKKEFI